MNFRCCFSRKCSSGGLNQPRVSNLRSEELSAINIMPQHFRFLDLPFDLRYKILGYVLVSNEVIDLEPIFCYPARERLAVFLVSKGFYSDASYVFYSSHTFRIFPTSGRFFGNKTRPLLARLPSRDQRSLVSLELRLGPGWTCPPASWRVNGALGLENMVAVRSLKVFVEVDPSHDFFRGFRVGKDFYTRFSSELLEQIIERLPALERVELDGWPSVMREGPLMRRLADVARASGKTVVDLGAQKVSEAEQGLMLLGEKLFLRKAVRWQ